MKFGIGKLPPVDKLIVGFDAALRAAAGTTHHAARPSPGEGEVEPELTPVERDQAARLMRSNHCSEVCAQALYSAQALTARGSRIAGAMRKAADQENDHLAWCEQRLAELDSHVSYLGPLWYAASFSTGIAAGILGDKVNLGLVAATEEEVVDQMEHHLSRLPVSDSRSRKVLEQMRLDETRHASTALEAGGSRFPPPVKKLMRAVSKLMAASAYRL